MNDIILRDLSSEIVKLDEIGKKIFVTMRNVKNELLTKDFMIHLDNVCKFSLRGIRINLKNLEDKENYEIIINQLIERCKGKCEVMIDLPYPYSKVRGKLKDIIGMNLKKGDKVYVLCEDNIEYIGNERIIYVSKKGYNELKNSGRMLFYGDGKGAFEVIDINENLIELRAAKDQTFYTTHSFITEGILDEENYSDFFDTLNNAAYFPDLIALSFVKNRNDILNFRNKITFNTKIVAKIESQSAVDNIDEIIEASDSIMLARGDLGYAIEPKNFYDVQEYIINKCKNSNKELIVATDILSSLESRSYPSRADIIDFQHIFRRVDSISLSGSVSYKEIENTIRIIKLLV
ncbi:pyruvate kinase [Clostridium thermarum]|uniref:pyruvate kinase n=1 Tax=Clostridium thermarum TaxID=1716543 RepID=UPI0013D12551|nr:pyruvate kinase [Clostridium thermarum]